MSASVADLQNIGIQMGQLVQSASAAYVKGHTADIENLGESFTTDLLTAIFHTSVLAQLPDIAPIDVGTADAVHIEMVEESLDARDQQLALILTAENQNAIMVAKLKNDATSVAGGLVKSLISLVGGLAFKALAPV